MPKPLGHGNTRPLTASLSAEPIVVAYGLGVDSTALLIGLRDRKVVPDLILFADTGSEKPETVAYLDIIRPWLSAYGFPPITVVKRASPRAGDTSLHGECLRKSVLPSLAYGGHSCSLKWKVDPQWAFTRDHCHWNRRQQRWPHGPFITKLLGYDAGAADANASPRRWGNGRPVIAIATHLPSGAGPARRAPPSSSRRNCHSR